MAINLAPSNQNIRRIAQELALMRMNYLPAHTTQVGEDGFYLPSWLMFVSEAQAIWLSHIAANNLDFDGKKRS